MALGGMDLQGDRGTGPKRSPRPELHAVGADVDRVMSDPPVTGLDPDRPCHARPGMVTTRARSMSAHGHAWTANFGPAPDRRFRTSNHRLGARSTGRPAKVRQAARRIVS